MIFNKYIYIFEFIILIKKNDCIKTHTLSQYITKVLETGL